MRKSLPYLVALVVFSLSSYTTRVKTESQIISYDKTKIKPPTNGIAYDKTKIKPPTNG